MKGIALLSFITLCAGMALGAQNAVRVAFVDGKVSIEANRAALGSVLRELDLAAGTNSTVPPDLATRQISVSVASLPLEAAVRKVFEGLAIDYAIVGGDRIVVLAASQPLSARLPAGRGFGNEAEENSSAEPAAAGGFQLPGLPNREAAPELVRGGRGRGQQPSAAIVGREPAGGELLPGLGSVLPFGAVSQPAPAGLQPAPAFIGNTAPAIFENQQPPASVQSRRPVLPEAPVSVPSP